ncbi:uncharacterized protein EDB91DRAFT_599750 [Suillus paluster]|uniref:uncharacterized protein n=1 Tax=Suillus paluster TaxID=48578 RepID=UPI001B86FC0B|nr:uncharacterized protein EDB91DRAFT_599750 [Suillus paluster]KAG1751316.1 hypothetical protein EDB91DRAFT_599750 [Suillus paluster]
MLKILIQTRDTGGSDNDWGTMQITAPIIVGVSLIVIFGACIIWYRWSSHIKRHYHRVRDACVSKIPSIFMPRHRHRLQHASFPITLDDSMGTPRRDQRRYHSYIRSDSTDSQTPLTDSEGFSYPPLKYLVDPSGGSVLEQQPGRQLWRWWRLFGVGPREVKPKVPSDCWMVDESSVGHGDPSLSSPGVAARQRWTSSLAPVHEQTSDDEGDPGRGFYSGVMQIGERFSTYSTPLPPAFHDDVAALGSIPDSARTAAPEYSSAVGLGDSRTMTTAPTTVIPQSSYYTTGATHSNSPAPPMYSSISHSRNTSTESMINPALTNPMTLYPVSVRAAGPSFPRAYHERQMSTESMLATSAPMVTPSMY